MVSTNAVECITRKKSLEESKRIAETYQEILSPNSCYHNVFTLMNRGSVNIPDTWKICYGYIMLETSSVKFGIRHCFFLNENEEVVDPTLPDDQKEYYIVKTFTGNEYRKIISEEEEIGFRKVLQEREVACMRWGYKYNVVFLG